MAREVGGVVTWLHPDHLGSAETGTDSVGGIAWRETHTPFGEVINPMAANNDEPAYTGHIRDAATGLNYMQARYQDPVIGRFLSIDPVGFSVDRPFMFNRYAYVGNDPVGAWDPDGQNPAALALCAAGPIGCGVGITITTLGVIGCAFVCDDIAEAALGPILNEAATEPGPLTDEEIDKLSAAGAKPDKGKRTKAGRSLEKKGNRKGSAFPKPKGNPDEVNGQGQEILDDILNDEGSTIEVNDRGQITVTAPDGRSVRFNKDGSMQGFREPEQPPQTLKDL